MRPRLRTGHPMKGSKIISPRSSLSEQQVSHRVQTKYIVDLTKVNASDVELVGGKNTSLGEMLQHLKSEGINVPGGFATTTEAYREFMETNQLNEKIYQLLDNIDYKNNAYLKKISQQIRKMIIAAPFPKTFIESITREYQKMGSPVVAVRSSATTEDLASASFAGMQETYLNIQGIKSLLQAIKLVFASLYTHRAILYRHEKDFSLESALISVGVQLMVRSDKAVSGVMFTIDTESGFDKVIVISASYGLGEGIVQGHVNPDEFYVYKPNLLHDRPAILMRKLGEKTLKMVYANSSSPKRSVKTVSVSKQDQAKFCLTDKEIHSLAEQALAIEKHYGRSMDIEWAKDGVNGKLYILQARPETVKSTQADAQQIKRYILKEKSDLLTQGQSIGQRIGAGTAKVILNVKDEKKMQEGDVLVTDMTDPDWEPLMKKASAIVTNRGGRTCHAAIIARELGIPAVVGCGNATTRIKPNQAITVSCAEGLTGHVYAGKLDFTVQTTSIKDMPKIPVKIMLNIGSPAKAFESQFLPNEGVGLARLEFIISNMIGLHPSAALHLKKLPKKLQQEILTKTAAYSSPVEYYVEKLREGIAMIAAAFAPKEVIFRFSDFKSNEYANLLGGSHFEPHEENPMIGFRGASRYKDPSFSDCFALECEAFKRVRDQMKITNAQVMVPFVRTVQELEDVMAELARHGMKRGVNGLKVYMMCEIPSNVILAEEFLQYVDGFSIGSNDLTQLTLGLDRDSSLVAASFDERNAAVKKLLEIAIKTCLKQKKYIGICGQGPSDHPDFAKWLLQQGIQSMSLNPDTIVETWLMLAEMERKRR